MKTQRQDRNAKTAISRWKRIARALCATTMLAGCLALPLRVVAVIANPEPYELRQPNGARFLARNWGDEWQNGTETLDGYTILREPATGWWTYAERDSVGRLSPSKSRVGNIVPSGLIRHMRAAPSSRAMVQPLRADGAETARLEPLPATGTQRLLVLVVDFTPSVSLGTSERDWEQFFFTGGLPSAPRSVRDYWRTASYNQLEIAPALESSGMPNNGIVLVTLSYPHPIPESGDAFGTPSSSIVRDAVIAGDPFVEFGRYDANRDLFITTDELHLFLVIRGYEQAFGGSAACQDKPRIWAHRSALYWMLPPIVDFVIAQIHSTPSGFARSWKTPRWRSLAVSICVQ
jgi:hypothetical protein